MLAKTENSKPKIKTRKFFVFFFQKLCPETIFFIFQVKSIMFIFFPCFNPILKKETFEDPEANRAAKPDHIYMDHMGFGMGLCCLQMTFQAVNMNEARWLYDQLTPITVGKLEKFFLIILIF